MPQSKPAGNCQRRRAPQRRLGQCPLCLPTHRRILCPKIAGSYDHPNLLKASFAIAPWVFRSARLLALLTPSGFPCVFWSPGGCLVFLCPFWFFAFFVSGVPWCVLAPSGYLPVPVSLFVWFPWHALAQPWLPGLFCVLSGFVLGVPPTTIGCKCPRPHSQARLRENLPRASRLGERWGTPPQKQSPGKPALSACRTGASDAGGKFYLHGSPELRSSA